MHFATIGGITLHYSLEGQREGVPLVFINSLGTDFRIWDAVTPHFADHFFILRYDKRGHGLSDCPADPCTVRDHSNDLAELLTYLNISQTILVGISVGGLIALDYALNHPQQVKALVLADTGGKISTSEFWQERAEAVRNRGMDVMADTIIARWFTLPFAVDHPAEYHGYRNMLARASIEGYTATCEALRKADLRASLSIISANSLVLCGSEDVATPPSLGRELAASLKNARFELIENAAHLPCIEQPDAMAALISTFFKEQGYGG